MTERTTNGPRDPRMRFALVTFASTALAALGTAGLCFVPLFIALANTTEAGLEQSRLASEIIALDHHLWKIALGMAVAVVTTTANL
jgi:formate hydrogenlyase subunit 3/multisubunit Na+/H+ antiporter MnhD subunit